MPFDKKQYAKEYYKKNKEKLKQQSKEYNKKNKEKKKQYDKEYSKDYSKTPQGKKTFTIRNWKTNGLVSDNYGEIYDKYISTTHCDLCKIELCDGIKNRNSKCMEHDHITGEFRNIVCLSCNNNKSDNKKSKSNTTGYKNICYDKYNKRWLYKKTFQGKTIKITRKNKIEILSIKFAGIILFRY